MELSKQIKKYRANMEISQETLAEKVYVTRQTISNWETGKSYPDIHSLLLLSSLFQVSLDELIKGDVNIMKEEIQAEDIRKFANQGKIFGLLFLGSILAAATLPYFFRLWGILAAALLFSITFIYAIFVEKTKKKHNIQTYREIVAFSNGERLDEISAKVEAAKRPYQRVFLALGSALLALIVCVLFFALMKFLNI